MGKIHILSFSLSWAFYFIVIFNFIGTANLYSPILTHEIIPHYVSIYLILKVCDTIIRSTLDGGVLSFLYNKNYLY